MHLLPNPLIIPVGVIIGILVAAPVGPVNVLCIQRAIERGFWGGIAAGFGAMLGDGLIALCAALGVGAISGAVAYHRFTIQVVGGLVLLAFGMKLYFATPRFVPVVPAEGQSETLRDFVWDIPQTFLLTITNPGAVLGLFAIFGGVSSFVEVESYVDALDDRRRRHGRQPRVVGGAVASDRPLPPPLERGAAAAHQSDHRTDAVRLRRAARRRGCHEADRAVAVRRRPQPRRRQTDGGTPIIFLKARLNAASDP